MGELFYFIVILICIYYLIQIIYGKLKFESKADKTCTSEGNPAILFRLWRW